MLYDRQICEELFERDYTVIDQVIREFRSGKRKVSRKNT